MELIAKKTFRGRNSRLIKKGDRFKADDLLGRVYLTTGLAGHPPREVAPPPPPPAPAPEPSPSIYQTRVMTAETAAAPRRRGRPRKTVVEDVQEIPTSEADDGQF